MKKIDYKNLFNVKNKNVIVVGGLGLIGKGLLMHFLHLVQIIYFGLQLVFIKKSEKIKKKEIFNLNFLI